MELFKQNVQLPAYFMLHSLNQPIS